jgi:hypothetical protein
MMSRTLNSLISSISGAWSVIAGAWRSVVACVAVAGLCLVLGHCEGVSSERARNDAARALANTKALELDAGAQTKASADRVRDALAVNHHEEELIDAISTVPDDRPDRVRVALGCQRLRAQGSAEADLPAICRP